MVKVVSYKEGGGGGFFNPEAGGYPAIIVGIAELGVESRDFQGDEKFRDFDDINIIYEIEAEQEIYDSEKEELTGEMEDRIGLISRTYNSIISDKSNLGKVITAVYDVKSVKEIKNFSLEKLLGLKCFINIELKGKGEYPTITSTAGANKKVLVHEQVRESFYFGMEDIEDFSEGILEDKSIFKPWDMERIKKSQEYKSLCKDLGIEVKETLDEQEDSENEEIAQRKADQEKADAEPTVSEKDAKGIFKDKQEGMTDEPATLTKARENSKAEKEVDETSTENTGQEFITPPTEVETPKKSTAFE